MNLPFLSVKRLKKSMIELVEKGKYMLFRIIILSCTKLKETWQDQNN